MPASERVPCPTCGKPYSARGLGTHRRQKHGHKAVNGHHGKQGNRLPDAVKAAIVKACRAGESRNSIARRLGVGPGSVSGVANRAGLSFDRTATAVATEAHRVDMAARRAALAQGLLDDVDKLRSELFAPTTVYAFGGKDNTYAERRVDQPPFADQLKIVQAAGAAIDRHLKLDAHDADQGAKDAQSMLNDFGRALGLQQPDA